MERPSHGTKRHADRLLEACTYSSLEKLGETRVMDANAVKVGALNRTNRGRSKTQPTNEPVRIDQKERLNKIDDEIIAEIRRSRFLVADFT